VTVFAFLVASADVGSIRDPVEILTLITLAGTVLVLAWQTRHVARSSRLASETAVAGVMADAAANIRIVFESLLTYPELRPYITDGMALPTDPTERSRAQTMCEMLCDALEASLETAAHVPGGRDALSGWPDWAGWILQRSPGSADHVAEHPQWYPRLSQVRPGG
jgi:hypothetical protein